MTNDLLKQYYLEMQSKRGKIKENNKYSCGANSKIMAEHKPVKPNNKIPIPLGKSAVTDITGYAGRPGEIHTEYSKKGMNAEGQPEELQDEITELFNQFDKHNREGVENSELLGRSLSLGMAWELFWVSDELGLPSAVFTPEYKIIPNEEAYPIWTSSLKPKLKSFIRFWIDGTRAKDANKIADVYYPGYWERYVFVKDEWIMDPEAGGVYPYSRVPVIPFRTSVFNQPVFEAQKPIMDAIDALMSNSQDEVDRYAAAILLFPALVKDKEFRELMEKRYPKIDQLESYERWPEYLNKDLTGVTEFSRLQHERLKEYFHGTIKIPDFMDKNFAGGDQSSLAIAFKLMGFEFLVSEIEVYFRLGLETRFELYKDIIDASTMSHDDWDDYEQRIIWKRNLPIDADKILTIAAKLKSLGFSDEVIGRFIPDSIAEGAPEMIEQADNFDDVEK